MYLFIFQCICLAVPSAYILLSLKNSGHPKPAAREIVIGDMSFSETALFTNIMITGAIGSGKTSSAIYPILDQICRIYNHPDETSAPDDPARCFGGLVMDVKGDFYEALICMMHWAGRNVLEDLVVITPWSDYEFAEMLDPDTGCKWFVSMRGGPGAYSNEFNILLREFTMPGSKRAVPLSIFTNYDGLHENMPGTSMTKLEWAQSLVFHPNAETAYLGWRNAPGGRLVRISHTNSRMKEEAILDNDGRPIYSERPAKLKFVRVRSVNNGLTFNIAPPSLTHVELANRLVAMSKNASGKHGGGGESGSYFDDATRKHIQWVIYLLRTINPGIEVTAMDINRHTVNDDIISESVEKLNEIIRDAEQKKLEEKDKSQREQWEAKLGIYQDMYNYFTKEWETLDERTKSNLVSSITNVFSQFLSDPRLRRTFCSNTAVKIDEIMQSGKVFTLVAPEYESAARVFGTSLKMEFQAILRRRTAQPEYDKTRFVLFMCDEVQNFVTSGGNDPTSGDESFMALSRQSKVCNVVATQADSSIISVIDDKAAEVYYAQFGSRLWYQNSDEKTNKRASSILGKVKREKVSTSGQDVTIPGLFASDNTGKGYSENISYEEKDRYAPEIFPNLDVHQCVIYNKTRKGKNNKSCKVRLKPHSIGDPAPEAQKAKTDLLRWYFRAFIENRLAELGQSQTLDHTPEETEEESESVEEASQPRQEKEPEDSTLKVEPEEVPDDGHYLIGYVENVSFLEDVNAVSPDYGEDALSIFELIDRGGKIPAKESACPENIPEETKSAAQKQITMLDTLICAFFDSKRSSKQKGVSWAVPADTNEFSDADDGDGFDGMYNPENLWGDYDPVPDETREKIDWENFNWSFLSGGNANTAEDAPVETEATPQNDDSAEGTEREFIPPPPPSYLPYVQRNKDDISDFTSV